MVMRAHDFVAWTGQIVMFVMLGLLVSPSRLLAVGPTALVLAALLAFLARPLAVALCLAPFRFRGREILLVGWVGLRGAVPIILAVIPVLGRVPRADMLFDVVFFVVLVSALLQGGTTPALTRLLRWEGRHLRGPPRSSRSSRRTRSTTRSSRSSSPPLPRSATPTSRTSLSPTSRS